MRGVCVFAVAALAIAVFCQVEADASMATRASGAEQSFSAKSPQQRLVMERMDKMPLAFTQNKGQWDERVKFRAEAGGATIWFTEDGVYYQFTRHIDRSDDPSTELTHGDVCQPRERGLWTYIVLLSFFRHGVNLSADVVRRVNGAKRVLRNSYIRKQLTEKPNCQSTS